MSYATTPFFTHRGDFDAHSDKHPASEFLQRYRDDFDIGRQFPPTWYTDDFTYVAPDGTAHAGRDKALTALKAMYGPLAAHRHEATYITATATEYGYEMLGLAIMWVKLPGEPAAAEGEAGKKVTDASGREWDLAIPGCFHFEYETQGDGKSLLLRRTAVMADTAPLLLGMVRRGLISLQELGIVIGS